MGVLDMGGCRKFPYHKPWVLKVMHCVLRCWKLLLCMLEVVEGRLRLLEVFEGAGGAGDDALCVALYGWKCGGRNLFAHGARGHGLCACFESNSIN